MVLVVTHLADSRQLAMSFLKNTSFANLQALVLQTLKFCAEVDKHSPFGKLS